MYIKSLHEKNDKDEFHVEGCSLQPIPPSTLIHTSHHEFPHQCWFSLSGEIVGGTRINTVVISKVSHIYAVHFEGTSSLKPGVKYSSSQLFLFHVEFKIN